MKFCTLGLAKETNLITAMVFCTRLIQMNPAKILAHGEEDGRAQTHTEESLAEDVW